MPRVVIAKMTGDRDPGYSWTSRAVLEAGLCLALQVRVQVITLILIRSGSIDAFLWSITLAGCMDLHVSIAFVWPIAIISSTSSKLKLWITKIALHSPHRDSVSNNVSECLDTTLCVASCVPSEIT